MLVYVCTSRFVSARVCACVAYVCTGPRLCVHLSVQARDGMQSFRNKKNSILRWALLLKGRELMEQVRNGDPQGKEVVKKQETSPLNMSRPLAAGRRAWALQ